MLDRKLRGQNSKKNNYSAEKTERAQNRIRGNIQRYLKQAVIEWKTVKNTTANGRPS